VSIRVRRRGQQELCVRVVFPDPVSPRMMTVSFSAMPSRMASLAVQMGRGLKRTGEKSQLRHLLSVVIDE
jgi:hypothetical protein